MLIAIDKFLNEQEGYWSKTTIKTYGFYLRNLAEWCGEVSDIKIDVVKCVTTDDLRNWLSERDNWAPGSKHLAICSSRSFFKWAVGENQSPAKELKLPKRHAKPQQTLSEEQVSQVLSSLDTSTALGSRNVAILCLMLDTGLRASEICNLRFEHLDLDERRLVVLTKGGNYELKVYSNYTCAMLSKWLSVRENIANEKVETVFVGIGGLTPGSSLTRHGLRAIFRKLGIRSGIGPFSPHSLRRTFATLALRGGAPTRIVQVAGGWKDLYMVERYSQLIHPSDMDAYFPINRVMGLEQES